MKTLCRTATLLFAAATICQIQHVAEAKAPSAEKTPTQVGDAAAPATATADAPDAARDLAGHSSHGEAFDEGPRQEAYLMEGMGKVHFPVSTQQERAQKFFNQGVAQLHGFWYFEAERSFRQTAALDPKCAMAYWGMAMANVKNEKRAKGFIAEAVQRKSGATPRESKYIDALDAFLKAGPEKKKERAEAYVKALETIICEHPEDIEAKALLALQIWVNRDAGLPISSAVAVDALLQQVLKVEPMHPCHHYRIHLWDDPRPAQALDSAERCGQTSPGIAHMWHMPGHIYSKLHHYADAAWHQEASARVDHAHMMRDRVLPDQIHNFAHNNEWLIRDLMHTGRVHDALAMAKNMIELPRHPKYNALRERGSASLGRQRLFDVLEKYELWEEAIRLCHTTYLEPTDIPAEQVKRLRCLGTAYIRQGDTGHGGEMLTELRRRLAEEKSNKSKAFAEAEAIAKKPPPASPQQKQVAPPDAKAIAAAKAEAAKPFDDRIANLEKAIAALEGHLAIGKRDYRQGLDLLSKAGDVDGMYLAQLKGLAVSADQVTIQQIKTVGKAYVAHADMHVQVIAENANDAPVDHIEIELTAGKDNTVKQSVGKFDAKQTRTIDFKFRYQPSSPRELGARLVRVETPPAAAAEEYVKAHPGEVQPLANLVDLLWRADQKEAAQERFKELREIAATADLETPVLARLRCVADAMKLPVDWRLAKPVAKEPAVPRPSLDSLGPFRWRPADAPSWTLKDSQGKAHSLADYRGRSVIVIFYLGHGCLHCAKQLQAFAPKSKDFEATGISMIAVSSDDNAGLKQSLADFEGGFPFPLVSDAGFATFKSYRAYDDFENQPLHATFLIDSRGLIRWQDIRYEPFMDVDFLLGESKRLLAQTAEPIKL